MNAIEVNNLTKIYRLYKSSRGRIREIISLTREKYHHEFYALRNVSFTVKKGQTIGIIGQNGSGKSTLLKIISGVVTPTGGDVKTQGRISSLLELGAGFNPEFTGRENVYMNGALMGLSHEEIDRRFDDIEAFANIGEFIDQPAKSYSSGMYVRLAFAAAINVDPDILIIDEALAVGDVMFQHRCWNKISEFKKRKTILFVSHSMNAIVNFCDEAIWLRAGQVEEINDPKTVSENYLSYTYSLNNSFLKSDQTAAIRDGLATSFEATRFEGQKSRNISNDFKRFGDAAARIISMSVTDDRGQELKVLRAGTVVMVSIRIECLEEIKKPIVGFTVRDRMGTPIIVTNTDCEDLVLPKLNPGNKMDVNFIFAWPLVVHGSYSFSPAIANGTHATHVMSDWIHDHTIVESISGKNVLGLVGLDNLKASYNIV